MLKKILSVVICVGMLLAMTAVPVNATITEKKSAQEYGFGVLKGVVENYDLKHFDEDGNEVDTTKLNREYISTYSRLPEIYDLRDENRITSVKSQGSEGLCWDFAATGSLESSVLSNPKLVAQLPENAHETLDFSEVGNTWYIHTNIKDTDSVLYNEFFDDPSKGTEGGWSGNVAMGLAGGYGVYPEELMPYENWGDYCNDSLRFYSDYRLKDFNKLSLDSVELVKQNLMEYGAISVSYNSYDSNYNYTSEFVAYYDNETPIDYIENDSSHAVIITGWDDNFSKENFCEEMRPENDGAWLCRNSWGTEWGCENEKYKGYFWMSYETSINALGQFEVQSAEKVDNIYQNEVISIDTLTEVKSAANVFTANSDEEITQICISNTSASDFTVDIYKLDKNYTSPVDGELLTSFTESIDYEGVHAIDCPQGVYVSKGDVFSVVVSNEDGMEIKYSANDNSNFKNICYVMDEEGNYIDTADIEDVGRVAIKAYTKNKDAAVYKDELSQSIEEAQKIEKTDDISQDVFDKLSLQLENAQAVMDDETATQNMVNNQTCLLNSAIEDIGDYFYEINTLDDFMYFYNSLKDEGFFTSNHIILNTNLDLSFIENFVPLYSQSDFTGVFNGNNHTISGLKIKTDNNAGLFSSVKEATIKDLTLSDCEIGGNYLVGGLTSDAVNSYLMNCKVVDSKIASMRHSAGGLVGNCYDSYVYNCALKNVDVIAKSGASLYAAWNSEFETCTQENVRISSPECVNTMGEVFVFGDVEADDKSAMLSITDTKCVVEEFFGEIVSVSVNGKELEKTSEHYEFDVEATKSYNVDVVYEDEPGTGLSFFFDFLADEIDLFSYFGDNEEVIFPSEISGYPVTSINENFSFKNDQPIKSIVFNGPETIENEAFFYLYDLEKLTFKENVKTIGMNMFSECPALKEVVLSDSVVEIGSSAFSFCQELEKVEFSDNLKSIGSYAFMSNHKLKGLEFPDSLETIGEYAFNGSGSTCAVFGKNIQEIGSTTVGFTGYSGYNYADVKIPDFKVYGYAGTDAQHYAEENGFEFIDINDSKPEIVDEGFDYSQLKKGDVDLDSEITIVDATLIQMYLADMKELNDLQKYNAITYMYGENEIDIMCVTQIQRYIAKLISSFYDYEA